MDSVRLGNGRITTQVAFGCGGLGGATGWHRSRDLLVAAWDAGVRHFDVAPSYGFGEAEVFLGRMLVEFGPNASVTTKVGIGRGHRPVGLKAIAWGGARKLLSVAPGVRRRLGNRMRANAPRGVFVPTLVRASVEESLGALRRDHIDILLLHEATAGDLTPELIEVLSDLRREGKIGEAGIGSRSASLAEMTWPLPPLLTVVQAEWSLRGGLVGQDLRVNRHGVLRNIGALQERLLTQPGLAYSLCELTGIDCNVPGGMVALLLALAASETRGGQIIAQSSHVGRVKELGLIEPVTGASAALNLIRDRVPLRGVTGV